MTATLATTKFCQHKGTIWPVIWGGVDKSLVQPTSRCRRMESIVSSKRGVCSCAELQVFSCYRGWKEECLATREISTTSRCKLSSSFFFPARQGAKRNSRHSGRNIRKHAPSYAVKNRVAQFKRDFSTCDAPHPGRPKTVTTPEIIDQIHELILEDRRILDKSIAEQLGISCERVGSIIHEDLDVQKLSAKWVPKCLKGGSKMSTVPGIWATFGIFSAWSKWLPVAIGNHGQNLVISLWPGDKATINGVAA